MSITRETNYKLVKLNELPTLNRNTFIQIVGLVSLYDEHVQQIQLDDSFGKISIELGKAPEFTIAKNKVVRIFGNWDGIKISVEKVLEWDILPEKLPILFSSN